GFDDCPSILSIPFYLWYENTVPADVLKDALFKTLEEFPILAGQLKTGSDLRSYVVIDKNHLNIPEYTDSFCNVHFQTLKDANFDVSLLPVDYSLACKCPAPRGFPGNRLKLAEFHVLRMKDNSGMCIFAKSGPTGRLNEKAPFLTNIIVDIRPRVKRLSNANYVGNAALIKTVAIPLELLLEQSDPKVLAAVACKVRRAINGISERYCEQTGYLFNKYPGAYVDLDMQITAGQNAAVSTNHTRFNYYEMDFGSGVPELVRPAFLIFENDFVIMPTRSGVDGYELAFTMVPEVAKAMMEDEYWKYMY
ncbi:hypothetical protein GGI11_000962, partial [Coemansia sp. RSA 2049]